MTVLLQETSNHDIRKQAENQAKQATR